MLDRYTKGQAVVIERKHSLLGVVVHVDILPVGKPGPHRYRYHVQPARLVDGQAQVISAALAYTHVHPNKLQAYDPSIHINPWRLA
jgi:hypothetical protein